MESCDHSCATAWRASDTGDLTSARGIRVTLSGESEIRAYMGLRGSSTALASGDSCLSASSSASPGGGAARDRGRSEDLATSRARKIAAQQPAPALPPRRSLESARRHFTDVANRRVSPLQPAAPSPHSPGSPNTSVSSPDSGHGGSTSAASAGELPGAEWTLSPEQRAAEKKSATELSMICREIDVLCRFKNEAVVNLIEYFVSPQGNHIHIVLELLKGGSLLDELKCRHPSRGCFTEAESRVVTRRVRREQGEPRCLGGALPDPGSPAARPPAAAEGHRVPARERLRSQRPEGTALSPPNSAAPPFPCISQRLRMCPRRFPRSWKTSC